MRKCENEHCMRAIHNILFFSSIHNKQFQHELFAKTDTNDLICKLNDFYRFASLRSRSLKFEAFSISKLKRQKNSHIHFKHRVFTWFNGIKNF